MFDLLRHPLGFIKNRVQTTENSLSLIHSDRSLFLGVVTGFLVIGYVLRSIDYFATFFPNQTGDPSILSFALSFSSVIIFSGLFLRIMVFSKKLLIEDGLLLLFDHWPFTPLKSVVSLTEIEGMTITTLFSHLSRKATIFISIRTLAKGNLKQVYSCLRKDLNELVDQIERSLKDNGIQVTISNENPLQN